MKKEIGKRYVPSPRTLGLKNEGTFQKVGQLPEKSPAEQKGDAETATTLQKAQKGKERTGRVEVQF